MTQNRINANPTQYYTIVGGANGALSGVAPGTSGHILTSNGPSANPSYQAVPSLDLSVNIQTFTSSGTYTPSAQCCWLQVELWGAGGASGGLVASSPSLATRAGGGGAGGYSSKIFCRTDITSTVNVTIGAGGTASAGAQGTDGGVSSFGAYLTVTGGMGGNVSVATSTVSIVEGTAAGTGSGGDVNVPGRSGRFGFAAAPGQFETNGTFGFGEGGWVGYGGMQRGASGYTTSGGFGSQPGGNYGASGSSGGSINNANSSAGGSGSSGICVITEWIFS